MLMNKVQAGRCKLRLSNHGNTERKTDMKGISLLLLGLPSWAPKCLYGRTCSPRKWSWMHWHSTNKKSKITCKPEWFPDMPEAQLAGIWCAPNLLRSRNGHQTCHKEKGLCRVQIEPGTATALTSRALLWLRISQPREGTAVRKWGSGYGSEGREAEKLMEPLGNTSKSEGGAEWIHSEGKVPDRN